jgi:oxygen-independent coproporphyrinogen-3 oxidase
MDSYAAALVAEWALRRVEEPIATLFFGGGTPGILSREHAARIAGALIGDGDSRPREWTVELSPASARPERLRHWKDLGVTRLSLGVQSFSEKILRALGRRQRSGDAEDAVIGARAMGFAVSVDLIFCVPGQTLADWREDLRRTIALAPDHISTYVLSGDEGSSLAARLPQLRRAATAGERFCRLGWDLLGEAGYEHYEVSNFARPGRRCQHNLNVWRMGRWLGLGPSAASQWRGRRFRNVASLELWQKGVELGRPCEEEEGPLTESILLEDTLIFGLRLREGIGRRRLEDRHGENFRRYLPLLERWTANRWLEECGDRLCLTDRGLLLADALGLEILCWPDGSF